MCIHFENPSVEFSTKEWNDSIQGCALCFILHKHVMQTYFIGGKFKYFPLF